MAPALVGARRAKRTERSAATCGGCTFGCADWGQAGGIRGHPLVAAQQVCPADALVDRVVFAGGRAPGVGVCCPRNFGPNEVARSAFTPGRSFWPPALRTPSSCRQRARAPGRVARDPSGWRVMPGRSEMGGAHLRAEIAAEVPERTGGGGDPGPAHGPIVLESAPPHPGLAGSAFPWMGRTDSKAFMERLSFVAPIIALVGDRGAGRVSLSRTGRARIDYRIAPNDARTASRAVVEMARISRAAGATSIVAAARPRSGSGATVRRRTFDRYPRTSPHASRRTGWALLGPRWEAAGGRRSGDERLRPLGPRPRGHGWWSGTGSTSATTRASRPDRPPADHGYTGVAEVIAEA
jgi:hypothetical protein